MKIVNLVPECRSRTDRQNREENLLSGWTRGHWTWAIVHRTRPNHRFQNLRVNLRNSTLHSCQNPKPKKEKKKKTSIQRLWQSQNKEQRKREERNKPRMLLWRSRNFWNWDLEEEEEEEELSFSIPKKSSSTVAFAIISQIFFSFYESMLVYGKELKC